MKKYIMLWAVIVSAFFSLQAWAGAEPLAVPEPFRGFDDDSSLAINYTDLNSLLDALVLNTGRSDRKKARPPKSKTGTRMKFTINRATINEGNRFFFEVFVDNEENRQTLSTIRNRLERIPSAMSLNGFSRDEQLAYWLNLYNVTIVDEIVKVYPQRELEDLLTGQDSVLDKKTLTVAGIPLSLNDIQFTILKQNYDSNPLIIYGLYQGIIGGPNIRKEAYSGKYVYADLIDNALEFVNSNRGTEGKNSKVFRVSSLYQRNAAFFDDFQADLTQHLLAYLEGEEKTELKAAKTIVTDINDWTVTDLYGTTRDLGGSFGTNNAALVGAVSGGNSSRLTTKANAETRYSPAVLKHLKEINRKRQEEKTGSVTIEEMGETPEETGGH